MNKVSYLPLVFILVLLGCSPDEPDLPQIADGPNFIIIITDDQRYDALSIVQREQGDLGRYPWLQTPNLDQLAQEGIRFKNAFVVHSLCSPSRASFLTGNYSHRHGIVNNSTHYYGSSFASELREHGYHTSYFGKWHMHKQSGRRPGFDYSFSFNGQGRYFDFPFQENGRTVETKGWIDHVTTDKVIERLIQQDKQSPFCYVIGFKSSHGNWADPPEETEELYLEETLRPVPNLTSEPAYHEATEEIELDPEIYLQRYLDDDIGAMQYITAIDSDLGKIRNALDSLDLTDNTYLIFTSDNGYYHGEHGLRDKRTAYEESMRIPFLIVGPGVKAGTREQMILNIDLAPTILGLANIKASTEVQGENFTPLLSDENYEWRDAFLFEYFREPVGPKTDVLAVRTDQYKMIRYPNHPEWTEVFDLANDPYETNNVVDHEDYQDIKKSLEGKLSRLIFETGY